MRQVPVPALNAIPRDIVSAIDYERYARLHLDDNAWEYMHSGAADEVTLRDNEAAFARLRLNSRVLMDVRHANTQLELFGQQYQHPVLLAPVAYQKLFHPAGEVASAVGAGVMGAGMVLSTLASTRLEEVANHASPLRWFQLYWQNHREATQELVQRAEAAGYRALVVTVDAPLAGIRNRAQRAGFYIPEHAQAINLNVGSCPSAPVAAPEGSSVFTQLMANAPTWQDILWLRNITKLPIIIKGILTPADAQAAIDHGAAGIIVSNHGGRILDTLPASIDALPAIAAAVNQRIPILLDGGIRRGTDIAKALACGATAVMIGRPYIYALATAGALGVAHLLRTLHEELQITMALTGCTTLTDLNSSLLFKPFSV